MSRPIAVIGNSPAALLALRLLKDAEKPLLWIAGHSTQLDPVMPVVSAAAANEFQSLYPSIRFQSGEWIREFKNKAFRLPSIAKEDLFASESYFLTEEQAWFTDLDFDSLRSEFSRELNPVMIPVREVEFAQEKVVAVSFADGTRTEVDGLIFCDRPGVLAQIESLQKRSAFTARGRFPVGLLQAVFDHSQLGPSALSGECFATALTREAGETRDRHAFGYFTHGGRRSVWTVILTSEESEDHHFAGKRIRRLKQALDRMFQGEAWLPAGLDAFSEAIEREQIRFLEDGVFSAGFQPLAFEQIAPLGKGGLLFFTDAYGMSSMLSQFATAHPVFESWLSAASLKTDVWAATKAPELAAFESSGR